MLTDTDSTCLQFLFISSSKSNICEKKYRDIILKAITPSKTYERFHSSHKYWEKFDAQQENLRKCLGYSEIESIDNPCFLTNTCNPKEYYELLENTHVNKKHKGIKKGSPGMNFENYASRITSLTNFDTFEKPPADYKEVSRLTVLEGEIKKKTFSKTRFSQFKDNRFYFSDGVTSLSLSHPYLKELAEFKRKMGQKIERYFWDEKKIC